MATTIITKNGSGAPVAGNLTEGELALDLTNKKLYSKQGSTVFEVGATGGGASGTFTDLTATSSFTSPGIDDNATSTAITIDASGNVDVGGTLHASYFSFGNTNSLLYESADDFVNIRIGASGPYMAFEKLTATDVAFGNSSGALDIVTSGGTAISIDTSRNVGIGTSAPAAQLSVEGGDYTGAPTQGTPGTLSLTSGGSLGSGGSVSFGANQNDEGFAAIKGSLLDGASNSRGAIDFYTRVNTTDTSMTQAMRIDSSGNVGIGESNPSYAKFIVNAGGSPDALYGIANFAGGGAVDSYVTISRGGNDQGGIKILRGSNADLSIYVNSFESSIINYNGGDTNDGLFFRSGSAATDVMTLDSSGNVGIGTGSGAVLAPLHVDGSSATGVAGYLRLQNETSNTGYTGVFFSVDPTYAKQAIYAQRAAPNGGGSLIFAVDSNTDAADVAISDEKMRLDASGNLLVGKTSAGYTTAGIELNGATDQFIIKSNSTPMTINRNTAGPNATVTAFYLENTLAGIIAVTKGSAPVFAASSDERLKDNIVDHESELANVMALRPTRWDWKDGAMGSGEGFIAQELEATAWSDLVSEGDDGFKQVSGLGTVETRLVKAIQEQQAMIEELKAEVAALKGA